MWKSSIRILIGTLCLSALLGQPGTASGKAGRQPLATIGEYTYTEGGGYMSVATNIGGEGDLDSVKVNITSGYNPAQDALTLFTGHEDITVVNNGQSLILSGTTTTANYNALLAEIYFSNFSEDPTADNRILQFTYYAGEVNNTADPAESIIHVVPVNDPPNVYIASDVEVIKAGTKDSVLVSITDPDNGPEELSVVVTSDDNDDDLFDGLTVTPAEGYGSTYYWLSASIYDDPVIGRALVTVTATDPDDASASDSLTVFEGTAGQPGAYLTIGSAYTSLGDEGPVKLDIDLVNTTEDTVAGLQVDIILSNVHNATYGQTVAAILNAEENDLPDGFQVQANLLAPDTLRVLVFSTTGAVLPPGGDVINLGQLCFTPAEALGEPDNVQFAWWTLRVSDTDGNLLSFSTYDGTINTITPLDVTQDGTVDIRDVVVLVAELVGRGGHVLPTQINSAGFQIRDVNNDNTLNVGDAIGIVNHILGLPIILNKQVAGAPVQVSLGAVVALSDGQLAVPVMVNAVGIAGIQATFTFDPAKVTLGTPVAQSASQNLLIDSQLKGSELRVVVMSLGAQGLVTAGQPAFLIPVTLKDESAVLNLTEITVADRGANTLVVQPGVISQPLGKQGSVPRAFALTGNRPNPFNPSTEIAYEVPQQATIQLVVYNLLGQEVVRLVNSVQQAGRYTVTWNAQNTAGQSVASGVYLYRMISSTGFTQTKRMTLLK